MVLYTSVMVLDSLLNLSFLINYLPFGTKSENFDIHLAILGNSDGIQS